MSVAAFPVAVFVVMSVAAFPVVVFVMVSVTTFSVVVFVVMSVAAFPVVVFVVVSVAAFSVVIFVVMSVTASVFFFGKFAKTAFESYRTLYCRKQFLSVKLFPGGSYHRCTGVTFPHERKRRVKLFRTGGIGVTEYNAGSRLYLVVEKFAEVPHISFAFGRVHNRSISVNFTVGQVCAFDGAHNVGQLAHARRFDKYAVGAIFSVNLLQRLCKIADE